MLTASGEHAKSLKKWKAQQCWSQICCPANTLGNQHVLFKILSCWKSMSQKKRGTDNSCVQQHEQNTPL